MSQPRTLDPDPLAVYCAVHAGTNSLVVAAPAKLNLFDTLEFRNDPHGDIHLACDPPDLPADSNNLVVRAAQLLRDHASLPDRGVSIRLTKRIPTQAGLGGGSSDAAVTLLALNQIWKLGLTRRELVAIASHIGSDVAFFLNPPAGWCSGRGEVVISEALGRVLDFVLVCPGIGLATAAVYRQLAVPERPVPGSDIRAAVRNGDPAAIGRLLFNRLEKPAFELSPVVEQVRRRLTGMAPCGAMMSGSGSAVFALCRDHAEASGVAERFRLSRPAAEPESRVFVVRSFAP